MEIRSVIACAVAVVALLSSCAGAASSDGDDVMAKQVTLVQEADPAVDVEAIVEAELERLSNAGYPAYLPEWVFTSDMPDGQGRAFYPGSGRTVIYIEQDVEDWAWYEDVPAAIRSVVRHEFGHAITYAAGWASDASEVEVRTMFADPLTYQADAQNPGFEVAAEAIGDVLAAESGEERVPFYVDDVSAASLSTAAALVASSLNS